MSLLHRLFRKTRLEPKLDYETAKAKFNTFLGLLMADGWKIVSRKDREGWKTIVLTKDTYNISLDVHRFIWSWWEPDRLEYLRLERDSLHYIYVNFPHAYDPKTLVAEIDKARFDKSLVIPVQDGMENMFK